MAAMSIENWDNDADFQGDFQAFGRDSHGTTQSQTSRLSSRRSESAAGDEDWNVVIQPDDERSTTHAIQSAKLAGIPLPSNIPSSALLGGTIKRLGKKKSRQKLVEDDWDADLEVSNAPLSLKPRADLLSVTSDKEMEDWDDLEGSIGIRFAGTKHESRNRSSSVSVMSPSLDSVANDSEIDDFGGLELPEGPIDLEAILKKRRAADADLSDISQPSPALEQPATMNTHKKSKLLSDDGDDFLNDFDLGGSDILDVRKRTVNKNLQVRSTKTSASSPRPATTLNFHDKPTDKPVFNRSHIPRPISGSKNSSRLEPVLEAGVQSAIRERRQPTTTSAQLLRAKRSMPMLRNQPSLNSFNKPPVPFLPAGVSNLQSPNIAAQRSMPIHLRQHSEHSRDIRDGARSPPPMRPHSRLSNQIAPDTPSRGPRARADLAPAALAREAAAKRTLTRPTRRRNFGDGSELEIFDDLPTSITKESKFVKQPLVRGPAKPGLRQTQSRSDIREPSTRRHAYLPDRMMTPAPPRTPASPTKSFYDAATPSYLRDTAASRIARESRLNNNARPRSEGPLQPLTTNWKAQVAARSPYSSPNTLRPRGKRPALISGIGSHGIAKSEKGMVYNPQTLRWEGNENTLAQFDLLPPQSSGTPTPSSYQTHHHHLSEPPPLKSASPSRPALITKMTVGGGGNSGHHVQVQNGMVYDPQQMKWLKWKGGRDVSGQLSPSVTDGGDDDEEDAFAGIEDLRDENAPAPSLAGAGAADPAAAGMASPVSLTAAAGVGEVHEEFDLGPRFIQLQKDEEAAWRRRCAAWFMPGDAARQDDERWRSAIRDILPAFAEGEQLS